MKIHNASLVIAATISGCASVRAQSLVANQEKTIEAVTICVLAENGLAEGQTARVAATYKTDRTHYAYLSNEGCGKNGVLNVGDMEPIAAESVRNFYAAGDQRCVNQGKPYVCVTEAKINADIKVVRGQDGKFAAELIRIYEFSFIEPAL